MEQVMGYWSIFFYIDCEFIFWKAMKWDWHFCHSGLDWNSKEIYLQNNNY